LVFFCPQFLEQLYQGERLRQAKKKDPAGKKQKSTTRNEKAANKAQALKIFLSDEEDQDREDAANNYIGYDVDIQKIEETLRQSLYLCAKCNCNKDKADLIPCKISKGGQHVHMSHQLITGWVRALVSHHYDFILHHNNLYHRPIKKWVSLSIIHQTEPLGRVPPLHTPHKVWEWECAN